MFYSIRKCKPTSCREIHISALYVYNSKCGRASKKGKNQSRNQSYYVYRPTATLEFTSAQYNDFQCQYNNSALNKC